MRHFARAVGKFGMGWSIPSARRKRPAARLGGTQRVDAHRPRAFAHHGDGSAFVARQARQEDPGRRIGAASRRQPPILRKARRRVPLTGESDADRAPSSRHIRPASGRARSAHRQCRARLRKAAQAVETRSADRRRARKPAGADQRSSAAAQPDRRQQMRSRMMMAAWTRAAGVMWPAPPDADE